MAVKGVQTKGWTDPAATANFWAAMEGAERQQMAQRIVKLRKDRGWSAEELAHAAGLSSKTISRLETGQSEDPRGNTIRSVAKALGVDREAITGPRLSADEPEGPLEEILRKLDELLARLPERALPAPPGELGRRAAKPRPSGGGRKRKPPPKAAGGSPDSER